ncbi:ROK family protein [Pseudofrankia inefficax]|uniref:ROK family protein n=1 Tax=Pseudofrankia inefficax (strain DSM 45817 / CECT 9037 / DDB 130130 / EuI1c) TaxID=298654 RepID=E3JBN1_PSEI1|nr:ROK family protein [Pseudofrankia inefficax]ADP81051.1 ROK family protein [Pseudofrankia inefficax]
MTGVRVGLDIGATKILGVVVAGDGTVLAQAREQTVAGPDGVLASAGAVLERLAEAVDGPLPPDVGVGVPGIVDRRRGAVKHAVNLGLGGDWFPLADQIGARAGALRHFGANTARSHFGANTARSHFGAGPARVTLENDLNAATWGAHVLSGADDLAYVSLGTGLAAGFVLDGVLRRGAHGAAGEIGHVPVDPAGELCSCGQKGCLELVASGSAASAAWPSRDVPPAQALFAAAAAGDPTAVAARDRFVDGVADAIRMLGLTVDPRTIILGGGVANLGAPLLDAVAGALRAQAATSPFLSSLDLASRLTLVPRGVPVGALGAAMIGDAG